MLKLLRILPVILIATLTVGPVSAATSSLAHQTLAQSNASTIPASTILGTVNDNTGAAIQGAQLLMVGPGTYEAVSDAKGQFTIANVKPGVYSFAVTKPGFNATTQDELVVTPGQSQQLAIVLQQPTLTSLREIGSVTVVRRGTFNTTPAAISNIAAQTFVNQLQPQVNNILNQTPGIVASKPATSSNNAVPGSITFPNIRGALSHETATLIDGHPLSMGRFGDYVTTFLNGFMLGNVEVIKGPGAASPQTNFAIGGTVNFRTKDPTSTPVTNVILGVDNWGGTVGNAGYSATTTNGKLGFVLDYAWDNTPGPFNNYSANFSPLTGGETITAGGATVTNSGFTTGANATPGFANTPFGQTSTISICCQNVTSHYNNRSELVKFRYKLSPVTSLTASYLGSQTDADQNGNISAQINSLFSPVASKNAAPGYTGTAYSPGQPYLLNLNLFPGQELENNNEPIFQAEIHTTLGKDSLLARAYTASIARVFSNGAPFVPYTTTQTLNGSIKTTTPCPASAAGVVCSANGTSALIPSPTAGKCFVSGAAGPTTACNVEQYYNNQAASVSYNNYFAQAEQDRLHGYSFQYDHFAGKHTITIADDMSWSNTYYYTQQAGATIGTVHPAALNIPDGSGIRFNTWLLKDYIQFSPKFNMTIANYFNTYNNRFQTNCTLASGAGCSTAGDYTAAVGPPVQTITWGSSNTSHYDFRLGADYRPNPNTALRFSMGSAIAPPFIGLLSTITTTPTKSFSGPFYTNTLNNGAIQPETAWGYDLGGDFRMPADRATVVAFDLYSTTLFNPFFTTTYMSNPAYTAPAPGSITAPLFSTQSINLNNAAYRGVELSVRRDPQPFGFGYLVQGALQRGYAYNLGPCFYSNTVVTVPIGSTPHLDCSKFNINTGVVDGRNFVGGGPSGASCCGSLGINGSVTNQSVPYAQGYGELNYRFEKGAYASLGLTYIGPNNSYYLPAFFVVNGTYRQPLNNTLNLQLSADNLFNINSGLFPIIGGGLPYALAAPGVQAYTNANTVGPRTIRAALEFNLGRKP